MYALTRLFLSNLVYELNSIYYSKTQVFIWLTAFGAVTKQQRNSENDLVCTFQKYYSFLEVLFSVNYLIRSVFSHFAKKMSLTTACSTLKKHISINVN